MKTYITALLLFNFLFASGSTVFADDSDDLPYVEIKTVRDLSAIADQARRTGKIIMLEVSASYCSYCDLLEEEIIKPMLRSGDYKDSVLIRQLKMDNLSTIKDINGNDTTPAALAAAYHVKLTPTLLFLDADGNEVAKRIPGVYSLDFFGGYVDEALAKGLRTIRQKR